MSRLVSTTLNIGDAAPPFALPDVAGTVVSLSALLERRPVLVLFAPGSWSPGTRRQLGELEGAIDRIHAAGADLVMVVSQDLPRLSRALANLRPRFPVVADERRSVARSYGVYRALSLDGIGVTRPAAFLVDRSSTVRFAYVGSGNEDLPETQSLVRLAAWLAEAVQIEETRSLYPADGEIWLDEHTSIEREEAAEPAAEVSEVTSPATISRSAPRTRKRRLRHHRVIRPPIPPTEA